MWPVCASGAAPVGVGAVGDPGTVGSLQMQGSLVCVGATTERSHLGSGKRRTNKIKDTRPLRA